MFPQSYFNIQADNMTCPYRDNHQSFSVTLHSDPSKDNAADFVYTLPKPLLVPRGCYDVGLLEFRCFKPSMSLQAGRKERGTNEVAAVSDTAVIVPFFNTSTAPIVQNHQYIYEQQADVFAFMVHINKTLTDARFPLHAVAVFPTPGRITIELEVTCEKDYFVVLPETIAEVFGFRRR